MRVLRNYISGEWQDSEERIINVNPSDLSEIVGEYSKGSREDTNRAIESAKNAFPSWSQSNIQQRFDILDHVGSAILRRKDEIGKLLSREEGKTLAEGVGETVRAGQIFKYYAAEAVRNNGEVISSVRSSVDVEIIHEPVGTVGIISPWNFPIAIPAWKIAPALAYGNCVVFKPAELVPGCAWVIANLLQEAGIPDGVFNLVMGSGSVVGNAIVDSPDINAITFTGSVDVGRQIANKAVNCGKKVQLEMGGKNPLIVLDDADIDIAVSCAINGAFFSTGQRCTASSRIIVTHGIYNKFCDAMVDNVNTLIVGDALKSETQIGPVAYEDQLIQDLKYINIGREEGARLVGGDLVTREKEGHYLSPALFLDTDNKLQINQEEIFGPVASLIPAKDYDEALAIANDTRFGLSAGICTTSLKYANHFKRNIEAGMAMINLPTAGVDYHVPFGGCKDSNYGSREQGTYAREFYTKVRTCYIG